MKLLSHPSSLLLPGSLALSVSLGLLSLARPFSGDQALFVVGAEQLARGDVLYGEFWDLKQPGIYYFYLVSGKLFGYDEVGIHFMELLWQTASALLLIVLVRPHVRDSRTLALVPLFTVGWYYTTAQNSTLTQVESLVGLPLVATFLAAWSAAQGNRRASQLLVLSGLTGGLVLTFKLMFAPLLLAIWLTAAYASRRRATATGGAALARQLLLPAAGAACVLGLLLLGLTTQGTLTHALYTWLRLPVAISELPDVRDVETLLRGAGRMAVAAAPLLLFAAVAPFRRGRARALVAALLVWAGVSGVLVLTQLWWQYLWMSLLMPVAGLAVLGADELLHRRCSMHLGDRVERGAAVLIVLALAGPALAGARTFLPLARHGFAISESDRLDYLSEAYADPLEDLRALGPDAPRDDFVVFGDPRLLYVAEQSQAIAINGWSPELFVERQCADVKGQLQRAQPSHVFLSHAALGHLQRRCPRDVDFLRDLRPLAETPRGRWFSGS